MRWGRGKNPLEEWDRFNTNDLTHTQRWEEITKMSSCKNKYGWPEFLKTTIVHSHKTNVSKWNLWLGHISNDMMECYACMRNLTSWVLNILVISSINLTNIVLTFSIPHHFSIHQTTDPYTRLEAQHLLLNAFKSIDEKVQHPLPTFLQMFLVPYYQVCCIIDYSMPPVSITVLPMIVILQFLTTISYIFGLRTMISKYAEPAPAYVSDVVGN